MDMHYSDLTPDSVKTRMQSTKDMVAPPLEAIVPSIVPFHPEEVFHSVSLVVLTYGAHTLIGPASSSVQVTTFFV